MPCASSRRQNLRYGARFGSAGGSAASFTVFGEWEGVFPSTLTRQLPLGKARTLGPAGWSNFAVRNQHPAILSESVNFTGTITVSWLQQLWQLCVFPVPLPGCR